MKVRTAVLAAVLVLFAVSGGTAAFGVQDESPRNSPVVKVVKEWSPSVVNISTERVVLLKQQQPYQQAYAGAFDEFFKQNAQQAVSTMKLKGIGSGVIVSKDGLIVTNAHVVNMASKIYVILSDGVTAEATVPAASPSDDIAILKITPPENLKPIKIADDVMIGETVVSIGNPFGLENSVSAGIISGTNRSFSLPMQNLNFTGLLQTDASINIGSSGGALLNLEGELVGINLAVVQGAQSIAFAIPAPRIKDILRQYDEYLKKTQAASATQ
jgi:serine protease Do